MSAPDFKSLLQKPADEIKKPKPLPQGTYSCTIVKHEFDQSKQKGTPFVRFELRVNSAEADVEPADLEGVDLSTKTLRSTYFLTPDSQFRVIELSKSCGHNPSGRSLGEVIQDLSMNTPVLADVLVKPGTDGETFYNEVNKLSGVR